MTRILILAIAASLAFSASASAQSRDATKSELVTIKQAVAKRLKDPDSAKLKNVQLLPDDTGFTVCGEVNAKNSYGGYSGFSKFTGMYVAAGTDGRPVAVVLMVDSGDDSIVATVCEEKGM